jgi:O-Antigen ligase
MTLITIIPGLIALFVCIRRGPERAFIDVYLPTLLLLPDSYHWMITGHLNFNQTAIVPIAGFLSVRIWRDWRWSYTDFLLAGYLGMSMTSEYMNKDYHEAQNVALQSICNCLLPYIVAKGVLPREDLYVNIAKRIVVCLAFIAILDLYEFRLGRNPFDLILMPLFPGQSSAVWVSRYGFLRTAGPYAHAIIAGIVFAIGYRLTQWLNWGEYWSGKFPLLPISKIGFCRISLIAGSIMTLSRGPWLGAAVAALIVYLGRARNRGRAITVALCVILFVGIPMFQAAKSYVWIDRDQATSEMESTAAYRHELIQKYIAIINERPVWGWGRYDFPTVDGLNSVDNHYLLLALTYGKYVLVLFVGLLLWMVSRLVLFCMSHPGRTFPGSMGLMLLGIFIVIIISIGTVWLGAQTPQLLFLITGWSEALILAPAIRSIAESRMPVNATLLRFERVMA